MTRILNTVTLCLCLMPGWIMAVETMMFADIEDPTWLFYQGNNDRGKTWTLSKVEVKWNERGPYRFHPNGPLPGKTAMRPARSARSR